MLTISGGVRTAMTSCFFEKLSQRQFARFKEVRGPSSEALLAFVEKMKKRIKMQLLMEVEIAFDG